MKYIDKLNNFAAASLIAGLGPNEGWLYMRLFWEANSKFWPDYMEFSTSELQKMTGLKSHNTLKKARKLLKEKGFISFQEIAGKKTRYRLLSVKVCQNLTPCMSKNDTHPVKIRHPVCQNLTPCMSKNDTLTPLQPSNGGASETPQDYKTNKTNKTIYIPPIKNNDLAQVFSLYQENITTAISPIQADKLEDDVKTYGKAKVMYAILRAVEVGKKNLNYIEAILKNGKKGENKNNGTRRNVNTNSDPKKAEADRKWIEQLRASQANQDFPWERPDYKSTEG